MKNELITILPYTNMQLCNLTEELWVDAYGYDGFYEVSNFGRIKTIGRWVKNGKSERWVKERIRKQSISKDGRLNCPLSIYCKKTPINISGLIFQSFNTNTSWDISEKCVMHKNKLKIDNRLSNLELCTISKSHSVNNLKGLLPHLYLNNQKKSEEYNKLTHKICNVCQEKKEIKNFEHGRNKCRECRRLERK